MFFFDLPSEICGIAELCLDLFLAVTVIVVCNQCHDHAFLVATSQLEWHAVIVFFVVGFPAHSVVTLPLTGFFERRQSDFLLRDAHEMWGKNHATGVSTPVIDIERRIMCRQEWITCVAEDGFNEIQTADQSAWHEESDLHGLLITVSRNFRAEHRPDQQRYKRTSGIRFIMGKRQLQQARRRTHRMFEQCCESLFRHDLLITRNRQTAFCHMKRALSCATIVCRIVQHAVADTV